MTFVMAESRRVYGPEDLDFARGAGRPRRAGDRERAAVSRGRERTRSDRETAHRRRAATPAGGGADALRRDVRGHAGTRSPQPAERDRHDHPAAAPDGDRPNEVNAVDRVLSSAQRMSSMVGQLLDLTRSRIAGGITLDKAPVDVGGVVAEVVDELRRAYPNREIRWAAGPGAARERGSRSAGAGVFEPDRQCARARRPRPAGHHRFEGGWQRRHARGPQPGAADTARVHEVPVRAVPQRGDPQRAVAGARPGPVHHGADCPRARRPGRRQVDGRARDHVQRHPPPLRRSRLSRRRRQQLVS